MLERSLSICAAIAKIDDTGFSDFIDEIYKAVCANPKSRFVRVQIDGGRSPINVWHCDKSTTLYAPCSDQVEAFTKKLDYKDKDKIRFTSYGKDVCGRLFVEYRIDTDLFLDCEYLYKTHKFTWEEVEDENDD